MVIVQDPEDFVKLALECSLFIAPRDPWLSYVEIVEAASRLGFKEGETRDAIGAVGKRAPLKQLRVSLDKDHLPVDFFPAINPDFRNPKAFDFIVVHLREMARSVGRAQARVGRESLVASAVSRGLPELDIEAAITLWLIAEYLVEKDGLLGFPQGLALNYLPSEIVAENERDFRSERERAGRIYEVVKDVIARRTDGRAPAAEPIKAFEHALENLGHGRFRMWWAQAAGEFRLANEATSPMTVCVLAAALSEGALTFVVERARKLNLPTMNSKTFNESPTRWRFDDLISSAASGGADAILDQKTRGLAERLNLVRQRIHVGRLMAEVPRGPVPDTRPEEAREAKATLELILRKILDWLDAHPTPTQVST